MDSLVKSLKAVFQECCPVLLEQWAVVVGVLFLAVVLSLAIRAVRSAKDSGRSKPTKGSSAESEIFTNQTSDLDSALSEREAPTHGGFDLRDQHEPDLDWGGERKTGPEGQIEVPCSVRMDHPEIVAGEESEVGFLERLRIRLARTQDQLLGRLDRILARKSFVDSETLQELEEVLVTADLGVKTSQQLLAEIEKEISYRTIEVNELHRILKEKLNIFLSVGCAPIQPNCASPFVLMVVGVNGVGKTTTIGKLAAGFMKCGHNVMLVAADTFRAAAIEQLEIWSKRVGTDFVKHQPGADPSAVVYDAVRAAISRQTDIVIIDTAGRLHTKTNLMEELKKVKKILGRELAGAPHEILLVLDATTGQNSIQQARAFHDALGITGIVLTKMDGTAKGGVIIGISNELHLPVRFIGIGEQVEDLREFDPRLFLDAIFERDISQPPR